MRTRIAFLIVLLSTAGMHAQVDAPSVSLDAAVFDSHGKAVTHLNRSDFELLEDGIPQTIRSFTPVDAPYNVLVLLDCRESTRDRLLLLTESMTRFVNQLRPSDRVEIAAFGSEAHILIDWTTERKAEIKDELRFNDYALCTSTDLYGSLEWSVKELHKVAGRRAVVIFSNGFQSEIARQEIDVNGNRVRRIVPPANDAEFQKVVKKVREAGSPFYFVAVDTDLNPGAPYAGPVQDLQQVRARVEQLAEVSGGRVAFPRESSEVAPLFLQIGRELGSSYSLAYTPKGNGDAADHATYHVIDVRVRGENYHVQQSRKGYTAYETLPR